MKTFLALLLLATSAFADQNPAPVNAGVQNQSTFTCGAASALAAPGVPQRAYLLVENEDPANTVLIKFNSTITGSEGVLLQPKQLYEPHPALVGSIWCKSASGGVIGIVEGSK